jgi:hypothetical protein
MLAFRIPCRDIGHHVSFARVVQLLETYLTFRIRLLDRGSGTRATVPRKRGCNF